MAPGRREVFVRCWLLYINELPDIPLSLICKLIEHIIHSQVINHLDSNGILTDKQLGFRKRRSCETQLLLITVQDLAQGQRDKQQIEAVLLDFSKAFDKVSHIHLLLKL